MKDEKAAEPSHEEIANEREHVACASSAAVAHWDQIDWKRCEQRVARLQARIVKASREGRWGKVKALQRLLTARSAARLWP